MRFQFVVDETTARKGQRIIREMTLDVTKLVSTLNQMNSGGGKAGTGISALPGVAANALQNIRSQSAGGGPMGIITKHLYDQRMLFQEASKGGKQALKAMSDALKEETTRQRSHIQGLKRELDDLSKTYTHLNDLQRRGFTPADPDALLNNINQRRGLRSQLDASEGRLAALNSASGDPRLRQFQQPGFFGQMKEMGTSFIARQAGLPYHPGETSPALQNAAIAGTAALIARSVALAVKSGLSENEKAPWDVMGRAARLGNSYGAAALQVRGGDLTTMLAYRGIRANKQLSGDFDRLSQGDSTSISGFGTAASGGIGFDGEGHRRTSTVFGAWWNNKTNPVGVWNDAKRGVDNLPTDMSVAKMQYIQAYKQAQQADLDMLSYRQLQSDYRGNISSMRALGIGAGKYDPVTDSRPNNGLRLLRRFSDRNFDNGDVIGAMRSIEAYGGRGTAHSHLGSAVYGNAGGIYSAGQIIGQAAAGGGNPGKFWSGLQNTIGRGSGGIDVAAANRMGVSVTGAMLSGAAPTDGMGLLGAWNYRARGGSAGEDMLIQQGLQGGFSAMGNVVGGRVDPYQTGTNLLSAIESMPQGSVQAQEYLAQLDPRVMFDVLGKKEVPEEMRSRGITYAMVKSYADKVMARTYDRAIGPQEGQNGRLNDAQIQAQTVQEQYGGDFQAYFKDMSGKLSGKDRSTWERQALVQRGVYLHDAGLADSDIAGQGFARLEAGRGAYGTGPRVAGRGAGDAAAGSDEAALGTQVSKNEGELERNREKMSSDIRADVAKMPQAFQTYAKVANEVNESASNVAKSLDSLAKTIAGYEQQIRNREYKRFAAGKNVWDDGPAKPKR